MDKIYLGLGSNLGKKEVNFEKAFKFLEDSGVKIVKKSSIFESEPVGYTEQPWFYNMVIEVETEKKPEELRELDAIIEKRIGREESVMWGPRMVDIDILLYGDKIVDEPDLQIPHQRLHDRNFVLVPLDEIAPEVVHPVFKKSINDLLKESKDKSIVKPL